MTGLDPEQRRKIETLIAPTRTIQIRNAADIRPRRATFLWWPYFPLGKVVIVAGAPGHGKSQFASLAVAMASRGALPGDIQEPSRALMMCAEDDLGDTVVPRLMAVNADLRRVDFINVMTEHANGLTSEGMIRLPGDVDAVHDWAKANVDARLVVMDPVASFFDRSHSTLVNQDIRDALGSMVAIAQTYGITIVIILHLNKSDSRDFMNRIAESHGFQALARSVLALGPDPDDPQRERGSKKVLVVTKANLIKPGTFGLRCEVRSVTLTAGLSESIETSELVLTGKCDISADDLLATSAESTIRLEIGTWLAEFIGDGWVKVAEAKKAATSDGLSWQAVDRVARSKGYKRVKAGFQGQWFIGSPHARAHDAPGDAFDAFDENGPPKASKASKASGGSPARARENGHDEYRRWEERRLGERDEET